MRRFHICTLIAITAHLILIAGVSAQSSATLTGTVTDQNRAVVEGANVKAINIASGRAFTATTDPSGKYRMTGLQTGLYRITAESEGFATAARTLTLKNSDIVAQDFSLAPGAIEDTLTVTVGKGSARAAIDVPQTVTVADDIENRRPASTLAALELAPNLTSIGSNPAAERPRLRGLSSNRLLLIVDGERLNNARSDPLSGLSPSIIDVTDLQSAEVIGGAWSSLYGSDALAGTINLVTKPPAGIAATQYLGVRFDGELHTNGLFRRGAAGINWGLPRLALRVSGSLFRLQDYHAGNETIPVQEVTRLGRLAAEMGNAAGNNVAGAYGVWSLPAGAEIPNGGGHGFNYHLDLWFLPSDSHSVRYRQINSQHKDIGFSFITTPFEGRQQFNGFRRLDKYGLRYEGRELAGWLPRLAASFYRQKYSFPDDNFVSTINEGSSWKIVDSPSGAVPRLTGNPSTFTPGNFTDGKNSVTSYGLEVQATMIPFAGAVVTSGAGYLRDISKDEFSRFDFKPGTLEPRNIVAGKASNPDSIYENLGWFNLLEYEPLRWLRLTGGFRVDNWQTEARITRGFPLGTESAILEASLDQLIADPGQINVEGLKGISGLVAGKNGINTSNTIVTGNAGVVVRFPGQINAYFRWGNSYREPGITERYILRDFGDPTFSVLLVSNTALKPERGDSYDAGFKIRRDRWSGSLGYFRNDLDDFLRPGFANVIFVPADPDRGLEPLSPFFPFHGVLYAQRVNTARARIEGVEADYEVSLPLGNAGIITPFAELGWLKGSDLTPDETALALIERFYNRPDTPLILKGSAGDAPLSGITPFRAIFGARYVNREWFAEYRVRHQARVERADPVELSSAISTQYGTLASLSPLTVQSFHAGYSYRKENHRVTFTFGVENLTDRFYFEHFQTAPAAGRSFVFGVTTDFLNILGR